VESRRSGRADRPLRDHFDRRRHAVPAGTVRRGRGCWFQAAHVPPLCLRRRWRSVRAGLHCQQAPRATHAPTASTAAPRSRSLRQASSLKTASKRPPKPMARRSITNCGWSMMTATKSEGTDGENPHARPGHVPRLCRSRADPRIPHRRRLLPHWRYRPDHPFGRARGHPGARRT